MKKKSEAALIKVQAGGGVPRSVPAPHCAPQSPDGLGGVSRVQFETTAPEQY